MYSLPTLIVVATIAYILGVISVLIMSRNKIILEKKVALIILTGWLSFTIIAFLQDKELNIFFNSAGLGAVGNLLGIKTSELLNGFIKK